MAPVLRDWVPDGDLAHFVADLVDSGVLELSVIYADYTEERGFRPYDPRLMVKLVVYGYAVGGRDHVVADACARDLPRRGGADAVRRSASGLPLDRPFPRVPPGRVGGSVRAGVAVVSAGHAGWPGGAGRRWQQAACQRVAA